MRRLYAALLLLGCSNVRPVDGYRHRSYIHPDGILNPASPDFHGTQIKNAGWDFDGCKKCHGDDFKGGAAGVSCYTCHNQGPTGCTTCHGQPPKTGAHEAHTAQKLDCTTCHIKPLVYTDAGHLDGKVTVTLEKGSYQDGRCSGVYCHGDTLGDANAKNTKPLWTGGKNEAICGSCHGLAPSTHTRSNCIDCHPKQFDGTGSRHIDGKISLGDESGNCNACHTIDPAKLGGAHLGHLTAPLELRGPLACTDCHAFSVADASHPDTAKAQGCTKCHLAGQPAWTDGPSAAYCGTCHPLTPPSHASNLTLTDCASCHPTTMDPTGAFVPGGTHINGVVDAQ